MKILLVKTKLHFIGIMFCIAVLLSACLQGGSQENPAVTAPPAGSFGLAGSCNIPWGNQIVFSELSDFFALVELDLFALVQVIDIEQLPAEPEHTTFRQYSTLSVQSVVWNRGIEVPQTITIGQNIPIDCTCGGIGIFREDGFYLLPLSYWRDGTWHFRGSLDVFFEIDSQARVWSHSIHEGFNRFDGEHIGGLEAEIKALAES